jgi:hypothetical protein
VAAKLDWEGTLLSVQPRIRLVRSFERVSDSRAETADLYKVTGLRVLA